MSEDRIEFLR